MYDVDTNKYRRFKKIVTPQPGMSGAKAACSPHGSPSGWRNKSDSSDFHELRQGFSPPKHAESHKPEQLKIILFICDKSQTTVKLTST
jgi:hypothetical protein